MALVNIAKLTSIYQNARGEMKNYSTESNEVVVYNMLTDFIILKDVDKQIVQEGDEITIIITLENKTKLEISDINIVDITSSGATFKPGSVILNTEKREDLDPVSGIDITDTLYPGETFEIVYTFTIDNNVKTTSITSYSSLSYTCDNTKFMDTTNQIEIIVLDGSIVITKDVDKKVAKSGETLTFFVTIKNVGALEKSNLVFSSDLPKEMEFIENSVAINNVVQDGLNPILGFDIPTLYPQDEMNITFLVRAK